MNNFIPQMGSSMPSATQPFGYPMNWNIPSQVQNNQYQASTTNKIVVDSIEDVKNYYVAPGGDLIFLHSSQPILFRKAVDNKNTVTLETFDIVKHIEEDPYVSKQEFKALQDDINELKQLLKSKSSDSQVGG